MVHLIESNMKKLTFTMLAAMTVLYFVIPAQAQETTAPNVQRGCEIMQSLLGKLDCGDLITMMKNSAKGSTEKARQESMYATCVALQTVDWNFNHGAKRHTPVLPPTSDNIAKSCVMIVLDIDEKSATALMKSQAK